MSGNNNKNSEWIAALFAASLGAFLWFGGKILEHAARYFSGMRQVRGLVRDGIAEGLSADEITQAFWIDAEKQTGRKLTGKEKEKIRKIVADEATRTPKVVK